MHPTTAVTALVCVLFLSACGIKGPLYLPPSSTEEDGARPAENGHSDNGAVLPALDKDAAEQP
jgi:predicted small lipoprotein YifL